MPYTTAAALIAHLVTLAGPDFMWPAGGARPNSLIRVGLMSYLFTVSGGVCAFCGEDMAGEWNVCHIVSGGPNRRGWVAGNLVAGCADCNQMDNKNGNNVVPVNTIVRPDLIPTEWPNNAELKAMGSRKAEAMARKAAKRGM